MSMTRRPIGLVLLAIVTLMWAAAPLEAAECKVDAGGFESVLIPPPTCPSPVGICTLGSLDGKFPQTYFFVMDTLFPANDDPAFPNKLYYTGHSVITRVRGGATILGQDSGVMYFDPINSSPFVTTVNIVAGTKQYKDASGAFVATGLLTFTTSGASGSYTSTICK